MNARDLAAALRVVLAAAVLDTIEYVSGGTPVEDILMSVCVDWDSLSPDEKGEIVGAR